MRCHNCNKEFGDWLNYCPYCGAEAAAGSSREDAIRFRKDEPRSTGGGVRPVSLNIRPELFFDGAESAEAAPARGGVKPVSRPEDSRAAEAERSAAKEKAAEERRRTEEAERRKAEEERRRAAKEKAAEERRLAEEAERRKAEEERRAAKEKAAEERRLAEEAERRKAEEERRAAREKAEEERRLAEEAERRKAEEERRAAKEKVEARRRAEEAERPTPREESTKLFSQDEMRKIAAAEEEYRSRRTAGKKDQPAAQPSDDSDESGRFAQKDDKFNAFDEIDKINETLDEVYQEERSEELTPQGASENDTDDVKEKIGETASAAGSAVKSGAGKLGAFFAALGAAIAAKSKVLAGKLGKAGSKLKKNVQKGGSGLGKKLKKAFKTAGVKIKDGMAGLRQKWAAFRARKAEEKTLKKEQKAALAAASDDISDEALMGHDDFGEDEGDFIPASRYYDYDEEADSGESYEESEAGEPDDESGRRARAASSDESRYVDFRDEEDFADDYAEDPYAASAGSGRYADFRNYSPPAEPGTQAPRRHSGRTDAASRRPQGQPRYAAGRDRDYDENEPHPAVPERYEQPARYYYPEERYDDRQNSYDDAPEREQAAAEDVPEFTAPRRHPSSYGYAGRPERYERYESEAPRRYEAERREPVRMEPEHMEPEHREPERREIGRGQESTEPERRGAAEKTSRKKDGRQDKPSALRNAFEWVVIRLRPVHIVVLLVVVALIAGLIILKNSGSPTRAFAEALNERNYEQAAELYANKYKGHEHLEASSEAEFAAYLNELKQHALEGKSTYSATNAALDVIKSSALYTGEYKKLVDAAAADLVTLQQAEVLFGTGKDKMNNMDYEGAIEDFNKVLDLYSAYPGTADLLATARDRYREDVLREVGVLQSQSKYKDAEKLLDHALSLIPDDPLLLDTKKSNDTRSVSALYMTTQNAAERYFQSGDFANVFKTIDAALAQDPEDRSIKELREDYETKCAENILNTADSIFLQGNRDDAIKKLEEGLKLLPDNALLKDSLNRYNMGETPETTRSEDEEPSKTTEETEPSEAQENRNEDGLSRSSYKDAGGQTHKNAVLKSHQFDGDASVVDQIVFPNNGSGNRFGGVLALGKADAYTQVYYQVYSSDNQSSPLLVGSLYASEGSDPGDSYKLNIDLPAYDADSFIVNLNYLQGGKIDVILDLGFTGG